MTVTTDLAHTQDRYYAPTMVGKTRSKTPEGYLICEGVAIARVCDDDSPMIYGKGTIPVPEGPDGVIRIMRTRDVLFAPETIASFEGKPITDEHPREWITVNNRSRYEVGHMQNVRAGTGDQADLLLADFVITKPTMIAAVEAGKKQVSAGYDAVYETIEPGRGRQLSILGNHSAFVNNGRGGHRVAIGDEAMADEQKPSKWDQLKALLMGDDEGGSKPGGVTINVGGAAPVLAKTGDEAADPLADLKADIAALAVSVKALTEAKPATAVTTDAADVAPILAKAEILSPGIKFATQDAGVTAADHVTACHRQALTAAYTTDAGRQAIDAVRGAAPADFATMDAANAAAIFNGAAAMVGALNNGGIKAPVGTKTGDAAPKKAVTPADINARNAAHYGLKH